MFATNFCISIQKSMGGFRSCAYVYMNPRSFLSLFTRDYECSRLPGMMFVYDSLQFCSEAGAVSIVLRKFSQEECFG